ncbi:MAG: hypothetical protein J0H26_04045 [Alphaproteobacteria bacterium]|nr:hypothetical protein [Alphaproteobacteria bacterium]
MGRRILQANHPCTDDARKCNKNKEFSSLVPSGQNRPYPPVLQLALQPTHIVRVLGGASGTTRTSKGVVTHANDCKEEEARQEAHGAQGGCEDRGAQDDEAQGHEAESRKEDREEGREEKDGEKSREAQNKAPGQKGLIKSRQTMAKAKAAAPKV